MKISKGFSMIKVDLDMPFCHVSFNALKEQCGVESPNCCPRKWFGKMKGKEMELTDLCEKASYIKVITPSNSKNLVNYIRNNYIRNNNNERKI